MSKINTEQYLQHPKFKQLVSDRSRLSVSFSLLICIGYGIFVIGMSYFPAWMSTPTSDGSSISYGIMMAIFLIIFGVLCSGLYMKKANNEFDSLKRELLEELDNE